MNTSHVTPAALFTLEARGRMEVSMMELGFDFKSLPFPYLDSQRPQLLQYKEMAILKEMELAERKKRAIGQLQAYVTNRLKHLQLKKSLTSEAAITEPQPDKTTVYTRQPALTKFFPPLLPSPSKDEKTGPDPSIVSSEMKYRLSTNWPSTRQSFFSQPMIETASRKSASPPTRPNTSCAVETSLTAIPIVSYSPSTVPAPTSSMPHTGLLSAAGKTSPKRDSSPPHVNVHVPLTTTPIGGNSSPLSHTNPLHNMGKLSVSPPAINPPLYVPLTSMEDSSPSSSVHADQVHINVPLTVPIGKPPLVSPSANMIADPLVHVPLTDTAPIGVNSPPSDRHSNASQLHSVVEKSLTTSPPSLHSPLEMPLVHRPVYSHPVEQWSLSVYEGRKKKTLEDPACRVTALVKGYLTRRLLCTEKVQDIVKTIKDAESLLKSLTNPVTAQDFDLQRRVVHQLQTSKLALHKIFFVVSSAERMQYISHSRIIKMEKRFKQNVQDNNKLMRLSSATIKSLERKRTCNSPTPGSPQPVQKSTKSTPVKKSSLSTHKSKKSTAVERKPTSPKSKTKGTRIPVLTSTKAPAVNKYQKTRKLVKK